MLNASPSAAAAAAPAANAAAAGNVNEPPPQQQQVAVVSSRDVALAVAAGILQPVVLELELRVRAAAAAAVAAPDDPRYKRVSYALYLDAVRYVTCVARCRSCLEVYCVLSLVLPGCFSDPAPLTQGT
jgi:hypothetical protein